MNPNVYYDYMAIIRNLQAKTFKISARNETEARAILNDNLIGDDYIVEDFDLEKQGPSQKKEVTITSDF